MNELIASISLKVYTFLLPISWIAFAIAIFVLVPMALFRRTRSSAGIGLFIASWLFGITAWTLGATVTFATYGWIVLLISLFFFGVGVMPVAIFAAFFSLKSLSLGVTLIVMIIIVFGCRTGGAILMEGSSED
jgi:hypothetical protein